MARRVFQMRDKHLSTTNLYPKQIEQSLPKDVVPVAPEPETYTPTGEEPDAEYITINNVTYKVGGGTNVVANPTMAGTEANLEGLQVGDTKYKVPSGGSFTQEQADWTEADNTKPSYIKNKPDLKTVATSGSYNDLTDKPAIPTVPKIYSHHYTISGSYTSGSDTHYVRIYGTILNNISSDLDLNAIINYIKGLSYSGTGTVYGRIEVSGYDYISGDINSYKLIGNLYVYKEYPNDLRYEGASSGNISNLSLVTVNDYIKQII